MTFLFNGNRLPDASWFKRLTLKMVPTYFWLNDERFYHYDCFKQSRGGRNQRVCILPEESYSWKAAIRHSPACAGYVTPPLCHQILQFYCFSVVHMEYPAAPSLWGRLRSSHHMAGENDIRFRLITKIFNMLMRKKICKKQITHVLNLSLPPQLQGKHFSPNSCSHFSS